MHQNLHCDVCHIQILYKMLDWIGLIFFFIIVTELFSLLKLLYFSYILISLELELFLILATVITSIYLAKLQQSNDFYKLLFNLILVSPFISKNGV